MPQHALIVGAGPGIGLSAAQAFGAAGMSVSLIARGEKRLEAAVRDLERARITVAGIPGDAGEANSLGGAIERATRRFGPVEVLVYNAVSFSRGLPTTVEPDVLLNDLRVNVVGALAAARAVLPGMKREERGTLLFTGGGWAIHPDPAFASMSIGKGALRTFVTLLAAELSGSAIRAATLTVMGTVAPGTPFDPGKIAEALLDLYRRPAADFAVEVQFRGAS